MAEDTHSFIQACREMRRDLARLNDDLDGDLRDGTASTLEHADRVFILNRAHVCIDRLYTLFGSLDGGKSHEQAALPTPDATSVAKRDGDVDVATTGAPACSLWPRFRKYGRAKATYRIPPSIAVPVNNDTVNEITAQMRTLQTTNAAEEDENQAAGRAKLSEAQCKPSTSSDKKH